jgi:DNA-binding HxlR family transcriptional regulator
MRPYEQYCPVAHALDLVGERWSLLVVRELQHGPLRYSDLHERLERCSTNVLASRLKDLEAGGVITRRRLPPPAASTVYELTGSGRELAPVLAALARWGLRTLGPPPAGATAEPGWLAKALRTTMAPLAPSARVGFSIGGDEASLDRGAVVPGLLDDADAIVRGEPGDLYALLVLGDTGAATVEGDPEAVTGLIRVLGAAETLATG